MTIFAVFPFFSFWRRAFLGLARQEAETHYETLPSPRVRIKACDRGVCAQVRFDHRRNVPGPLARVELHRNRRASITSAECGDTERSRRRRQGARLLLANQLQRRKTRRLCTQKQGPSTSPPPLPLLLMKSRAPGRPTGGINLPTCQSKVC